MKHAYLIGWALAVSACSSNAPVTTEQAVEHQGEWFCQVGDDDEAWDCVQDDALAADPQPDRLPEPPAPEPPPSIADRGQATEAGSSAPAAPITASVSEPRTAMGEPAVPADQATAPTSVDADDPEANLPKYVRLAYNPPGTVGLLDVPAEFFAVQLVAVSSKEALEDYVKKHGLRGMAAARIATDGELFYVLLLGIYETQALAQEAIADVPPPLDELDFWIRSMGGLQRAMVAGNALAGTDEV